MTAVRSSRRKRVAFYRSFLKKLRLTHYHDAALIAHAQKKMPQHLLGPNPGDAKRGSSHLIGVCTPFMKVSRQKESLPLLCAKQMFDYYPACAAFLASHHQTVGKAALPYFGIRSGWPKRSHRAVRTLL